MAAMAVVVETAGVEAAVAPLGSVLVATTDPVVPGAMVVTGGMAASAVLVEMVEGQVQLSRAQRSSAVQSPPMPLRLGAMAVLLGSILASFSGGAASAVARAAATSAVLEAQMALLALMATLAYSVQTRREMPGVLGVMLTLRQVLATALRIP